MRNVLLNPIALGAFGIMMGIGTANAQTGDAATWIRITAFTEVPLSWATVPSSTKKEPRTTAAYTPQTFRISRATSG